MEEDRNYNININCGGDFKKIKKNLLKMMLPENNNLAVTTANLLLSYVFRIRNNLEKYSQD